MTVALQFTAIDVVSGIAARVSRSIANLGASSQKVKHDFDEMTRHITTGLKAIAASAYLVNKIRPGITAAGDLQEAMIDVRMNLMESGKNAQTLSAELADIRRTAVDVAKIAPFSATDVVAIENVFLKAGLKIQDVVGKRGAAYAATALSTLSKEPPDVIAEAMVMMATPFGIKGGQFGELADFIQRVDAASATTIPELMEGMKYLSGTAAEMKLSWQDTLKLQGMMAQSGLRGSMGGTALNAFLTRLTGGTREVKRLMPQINAMLAGRGAKPLKFFDKQGNMKTIPDIIDTMRQAMKKLNDQEKLIVMNRIFGDQGARAALALIREGEGSWQSFGDAVERAATLEDKMNERLEGLNANIKTLAGTARTTLAALFDPLLAPLTKTFKLLNDITGKIGEVAGEQKALSYGVSGGVVAGALTLGAYGIYKLIKGGKLGASVLKGMGGFKGLFAGLGSTGAGIAKGKAVEAATGVTPVFVTNWPTGGIGGATGILPGLIIGGGGMLKILPLLKAVGTLAAITAALAGASKLMGLIGPAAAGMVAGADGVHIGTKINESLDVFSQKISGGKNANLGEMIYDFIHADPPEVKNNFNIKFEGVGDGRIKATTDDMNTHIKLARGFF